MVLIDVLIHSSTWSIQSTYRTSPPLKKLSGPSVPPIQSVCVRPCS